MFFDGWQDLVRIVVVGVSAYIGLIVLLRTTGKRTLSKMNAFDLVVTVALGSTLATILLSRDVTLSEGMLAFLLLCGLQYGVAWASVRWQGFRELVKSEPTLLFYGGAFLEEALRRERVTREEVVAALRSDGVARLDGAAAVVLETDGSFSVVKAHGPGEVETLRFVRRSGGGPALDPPRRAQNDPGGAMGSSAPR